MLRSLNFQFQIIKFCILRLIKIYCPRDQTECEMAGYKTFRDKENKAARPKWPFITPEYLMMLGNEDCETDGAVNEFRQQQGICSERL